MFRVTNEAETAEIVIYDRIGKETNWWTGEETGVSAEEFRNALKEVSPKPVDIHIDSGGGDVFEGFAMCAAIQAYRGKTTAYVDGLAASAASYIAAVCDEVKINDYAYIMIHCASARAVGNARYMEDIAVRLRQTDANLAHIYAKRSNLSVEEVIGKMEEETWFTGADAYECGLATELVETEERLAACIAHEFADEYRHVPEAVSIRDSAPEAPRKPVEQPVSHPLDNLDAKVDEPRTGASYLQLDGRIYRKEVQDA